ncbi:sensor histidine kinase [Paenibacillus guangzhouensis]|uniref:sensor histidine kinase n=1 Tax=Paenibacillus guangzhouensis TaxID=1473112 RepID=UPI001266F94D|nr:histidine kinase [Paenibacillus guangzhouensis]
MPFLDKPRFKSIRYKLIFGFLIVMLPLIAFLLYNNFYAIEVVRSQIAKSFSNLTALYMGQIDRNLEELDKYLYNLSAQNTDLLSLEFPEDRDPDQYYFAKIRLFNALTDDIANYPLADMFFVYSAANDELITTPYRGTEYAEHEARKADVNRFFNQEHYVSKQISRQWFVRQIHQTYYLSHIVPVSEGVFIGAWVRASNLMMPMSLIDLGEQGRTVLSTSEEQPMSDASFISQNGIDLALHNQPYNMTGTKDRYLVVGDRSSKGDFTLLALIPDRVILEQLPFLQRMGSVISIGAAVLMIAVLLGLRKVILLPINRIVTAMRRVQDGNLDVRIAQGSASMEFELMNATFNTMASQIKELKIHVYEEQLNLQRAELQYLHLQMKPHFFLNALNIIYNLAEVRDYSLIQDMSRSLVQHFRFMFRSNLSLVLLQDELEHTRNYLHIQELRFPGHVSFEIDYPESFVHASVPPLIIQTFVENTVKHAVTLDEPLLIRVRVEPIASSEGEEQYMKILIEDTGGGFPAQVLEQLQRGEDMGRREGEHIGVWNVQRRLGLLYQGKAKLLFYNGSTCGAVVEIHLPVRIQA